jgi:hypothetical protein
MEDLQVTGNDDVPGEVLKLFGEMVTNYMTQLINNIHWRMAEGFH